MAHVLIIIVQTAINAFKLIYLIIISAPENYVSKFNQMVKASDSNSTRRYPPEDLL